MKFTIVVPAYNEERRVAGFLGGLSKAIGPRGNSAQTVLMMEGADGGAEAARRWMAANPKGRKRLGVEIIYRKERRGKGEAIAAGVRAARFERVCFVDCDPHLELRKIPDLVRALDSCDLSIGSRDFDRRRPLVRKVLSFGFNALVRLALGLPYRDTQCGMKAARKGTFLRILRSASSMGFDVDLVALVNAKRDGLSVGEVTVREEYGRESRFDIIGDSFSLLGAVMRLAARRSFPR